MPIFVGNQELVNVGEIKLGSRNVTEVYLGSTKIWPAVAPPTDHVRWAFRFSGDGFLDTASCNLVYVGIKDAIQRESVLSWWMANENANALQDLCGDGSNWRLTMSAGNFRLNNTAFATPSEPILNLEWYQITLGLSGGGSHRLVVRKTDGTSIVDSTISLSVSDGPRQLWFASDRGTSGFQGYLVDVSIQRSSTPAEFDRWNLDQSSGQDATNDFYAQTPGDKDGCIADYGGANYGWKSITVPGAVP